ncbi:hypothetical protein N9D31_00340 [Oligoflexaceae bacterium]|nr:hypothetical protein [Oligoflexaceae bacterium]
MNQNHQDSLEKVDNLLNLTRAKSFLGQEFLTWLWFLCESDEEWVDVKAFNDLDIRKISIWIDDKIVLESSVDKNLYTLKGGSPSQSIEAAASLRTGKAVREVKLGINILEMGEFVASLNATDLCPRGLKIPELEIDEDSETESIIEHKLLCCEAFTACLDALFLKFLNERIEDDWESSGLSHIKKWMKSRSKGFDRQLLH